MGLSQSKTDEHVGCGYVIYKGSIEISSDSIKLPDYVTVYQAEVLALSWPLRKPLKYYQQKIPT